MGLAENHSANFKVALAAAKFLFLPGAVHEVRVPKAGKDGTISGYTDNLETLARLAIRSDGKAAGVYWTLNPVLPALKARAYNRTRIRAENTTSDADIIRLTNFLIDVDSLRPAGISATDVEHQAALDLARKIRDYLMGEGWPEACALMTMHVAVWAICVTLLPSLAITKRAPKAQAPERPLSIL